MVDQLNLEKKGIPTVTVVTTAFEEMIRSLIRDQEISEMALVVEPHPIAGHNPDGVRKKAEAAFPVVLKAATQWRPGKN